MSIGDGAVEVNFGVGYTDGRGAYVLVGVKLVTADSHLYAIGFRLSGSHCAYKVCVGDFATRRYLVWFDKKMVWVPPMTAEDERCFETPWEQRPSSFVREVFQVAASGLARIESIVSARPVVGLYILPETVGSCLAELI